MCGGTATGSGAGMGAFEVTRETKGTLNIALGDGTVAQLIHRDQENWERGHKFRLGNYKVWYEIGNDMSVIVGKNGAIKVKKGGKIFHASVNNNDGLKILDAAKNYKASFGPIKINVKPKKRG